MDELPTGTVTLLFTDMEGSTRLLQQVGERYADVLEGVATFCSWHSIIPGLIH
jgi:class 3 adenylate cyclase